MFAGYPNLVPSSYKKLFFRDPGQVRCYTSVVMLLFQVCEVTFNVTLFNFRLEDQLPKVIN